MIKNLIFDFGKVLVNHDLQPLLERHFGDDEGLILGGGMTYTFAAAEGGKVGNSICEPDQFQTALDILAKACLLYTSRCV